MKPRILFIDRDGTLIKEPPEDFQVDSLEKLEFLPGVFRNLYRLRQLTGYRLVIVSNQDGMGTASFPEEDFRKVQDRIIGYFQNEGITFDEVLIDPSLPAENSPNRKPRTGMVQKFMNGEFDLAKSFVIGDRLTDLELARNMGTGAILLNREGIVNEVKESGMEGNCVLIASGWDEITSYIRSSSRSSSVERKTNETDVRVELGLDGTGKSEISTGLAFFDHMLDQIARHGDFDLKIRVRGDLHVDEHHTIEDTALALGEAFLKALGEKRGINRYGFLLPMDDSLAQVAVDFGGRPWLIWDATFKREKVGDVPTEMFYHFFKSFADSARCNLNVKVQGNNEHHMIEAVFKAFSKALRGAVSLDPDKRTLPSTKGMI